MSRTVSIGTMVQQIGGLLGTDDISEWEEKFITDMVSLTSNGRTTGALSEREIAKVEQIWERHFA